jgi:hypothetical protein
MSKTNLEDRQRQLAERLAKPKLTRKDALGQMAAQIEALPDNDPRKIDLLASFLRLKGRRRTNRVKAAKPTVETMPAAEEMIDGVPASQFRLLRDEKLSDEFQEWMAQSAYEDTWQKESIRRCENWIQKTGDKTITPSLFVPDNNPHPLDRTRPITDYLLDVPKQRKGFAQ